MSGAALNAVPSFTLERALQGKLAGVRVDMNDGAPWSDGQIQIRGPATLYGDPSPLVIVDGVMVTNAMAAGDNGFEISTTSLVRSTARLSEFTPFEIASVEVLKGPAATALYGARGANGVLLITTRRSASTTSQWRAMQRTGRTDATRLSSPRCFATVAAARAAFPMDSTAITSIAARGGGQLPCLNAAEEFFSNSSISTESAVQWGGGYRSTRLLASVSHKNSPSAVSGTGVTRTNLRLNADQALGERVQARISVSRSIVDEMRGGGSDAASTSLACFPSYADLRETETTNVIRRCSNPLDALRTGADNQALNRTTIGVALKADLLQSDERRLQLQYTGGVDRLERSVMTLSRSLPQQYLGQPDAVFLFRTAVASASHIDNHRIGALLETRVLSGLPVTLEAVLSLDRQQYDSYSDARADVEPSIPVSTSSSAYDQTNTVVGTMLRASSLLLERRLAWSASYRYDRLGNVAEGFPSLSASYRLPDWRQGLAVSVRGAWGQSGGQGALGTMPLRIATTDPFGGGGQNTITTRFERRSEWETGADIAFAPTHTTVSLSAYRSTGSSLFVPTFVAQQGGSGEPLFINGGGLRTTGYEVTVRQRLLATSQVQWSATAVLFGWQSSLTELSVPPRALFYGQRFASQYFADGQRLGGIATVGSSSPQVLGSAVPSLDAALTNSLRIGALEFHIQLDARNGSDRYSDALIVTDQNRTSADFDSAANAAGQSQGEVRRVARLVGDSSGLYLTPASFLRLREIALRVMVPRRLSRVALGAVPLRLTAQARNLALWTRSIANDPEFSGTGTNAIARMIDNSRHPTMRQVFVGVELGAP